MKPISDTFTIVLCSARDRATLSEREADSIRQLQRAHAAYQAETAYTVTQSCLVAFALATSRANSLRYISTEVTIWSGSPGHIRRPYR